MTAPTLIRTLDVTALNIPLKEPFRIAGGLLETTRNLLVTIELADGTRGYGEAAPFPAFNGETQETALKALETAKTMIEGADAREWRAIAIHLRQVIGAVGSARCAIETALLDALTRHAGISLWAFFGGGKPQLESDMTISIGTVEQAVTATRAIVSHGIKTIKVKVGAQDMSLDLARIMAIHTAAPDSILILDGNGGLTADTTLKLLSVLHVQGITPMLFEQPTHQDDWEGLRQVTQWSGIVVIADESVTQASVAMNLARDSVAHGINVKLMKCGIVEALDIVAVCRAAHLRLMCGALIETILSITVSACFAAGLGCFHDIDLDSHLFLAENPCEGGVIQHGGILDVSRINAGHGVTVHAAYL